MRRDEVLSILTAHREELQQAHGVKSLSLFGSVARDEAGPDSDVDILVEFDRRPVGLFELARIQDRLGTIVETEVDLIPRDSLKHHVRPNVEQDLIEIFGEPSDPASTPRDATGHHEVFGEQ